jgi:hypothetical protein
LKWGRGAYVCSMSEIWDVKNNYFEIKSVKTPIEILVYLPEISNLQNLEEIFETLI